MIRRVLRRLRGTSDDTMSEQWLSQHVKATSTRIDYHGPCVRLPIDKITNERGWVNRRRLRRSA